MTGYKLPKFCGLTDPEDFIKDFCRRRECANYDRVLDIIRIKILENCMKWGLQNNTANIGVENLRAVNVLTNNNNGIRINVARFRDRACTIRTS